LLSEKGISYTYREYTKDPLSVTELEELMKKLGGSPRDVLRSRDASKAGLTGQETDAQLLSLMAENPRLLQRPIGVVGQRAVVGRPAEALLALLPDAS